MREDPRESDDPLQGHLFWSRRGGRDLSAEVDYDRPCTVCGYNLRGMPLRSRCPECGSLGGWNLYDEPVAWDDDRTPGAFISTCLTAIFRPHRLARHVWRPARMDLLAARRFRRIALTIASISLIIVAFVITLRTCGIPAALLSIPFQSAAIIVWLNAVTLEPLSRLKEWSGNSALARRVQCIVHYASATLVLSPLHVVLVLLVKDASDFPWQLQAAMHVGLLIVQLWLASIALGWLLYELIDMPKIQAHVMALGPVITATASAAIVLFAVPATIAMLALKIVGS
jgi:hypothetical protein